MCAAVKTFGIGKFDLNPRGNLWAKDGNKFGQRLLSKMGWSEGKGLGKNENGITEGIKVRMKFGYSGVGFTEKLQLGIENHEYDAVLDSLNKKFKTNSKATKVETNSDGLEQRSQQFKNRLHYQKFLRGKDFGRYSEKDMDSIFVTRKSDAPVTLSKSDSTDADNAQTENSTPEELPTFKSQLSMNDYFKMKLKNKSGEAPQSTLVSQNTSSSHDNGISNKKRKAELKNNSRTYKKLKSEPPYKSDDDGNLPKVAINNVKVKNEESNGGGIPAKEKQVGMKSKKLAGKLGSLKSCLKSKFLSNQWFTEQKKEVSFNDSVSYTIIEDAPDGDLACCEAEGCYSTAECTNGSVEDWDAVEGVPDGVAIGESSDNRLHADNYTNITVNESVKSSCVGTAADDMEDSKDDASDIPKCFDIPKCDNANYNTWLESQRIAIKMKLYKNMVKKIKKNPVLRTSNLLDIKGYGNWGI